MSKLKPDYPGGVYVEDWSSHDGSKGQKNAWDALREENRRLLEENKRLKKMLDRERLGRGRAEMRNSHLMMGLATLSRCHHFLRDFIKEIVKNADDKSLEVKLEDFVTVQLNHDV